MPNTLGRSVWISTATLLALAALLVLTVTRLGGRVPASKPLGNSTNQADSVWLAFQDADRWFQAVELTRLLGQTNAPNPFFTQHFQPPPPPSTKSVELTYLGFMESDHRPRRAFLQIDNATRVFTNGAPVVGDHIVREIARRTLILTNGTATNVLEFRIKKVIEIPAH